MSAAVQACANCNPFVYFPPGTYQLNSTVTVLDGQMIFGDSRTAAIINSPAGVQTFRWAPPGATDRDGPGFSDLTINSDYPIIINNLTALLADESGDSPCKGSSFERLILNSVTASNGTGITASKLFDSVIQGCRIQGYAIGILLHGSDLNQICDNRIAYFGTYGILDQSAQTFGSQNEIRHNDILAPALSTATFIKTTSRHVRIYDNYMEISSGSCRAFIDVTSIGAPTFGSNVITLPWSINIENNRCDGESFAQFVYRIDPSSAVSIVCENSNTVGAPGTSTFTAPIVAMPNPSSGHVKAMRIVGESWGPWHEYRTRGPSQATGIGLVLTGENIECLIHKDGTYLVQITGKIFVIPPATPGPLWFLPGGAALPNQYFAAGVGYTGTVVARSTAASGDALQIAVGSNGHGDALNVFQLTNQFKRFTWTFSGRALSGFDHMGAYMYRSGANGNIEILSISFEQS